MTTKNEKNAVEMEAVAADAMGDGGAMATEMGDKVAGDKMTDDAKTAVLSEAETRERINRMHAGMYPYIPGRYYLFRLVTMYWDGRLIGGTDKEFVLDDAGWVANTGDYGKAVESGTFTEIDDVGGRRTIINRSAIIDAVPLKDRSERPGSLGNKKNKNNNDE